MCHSIDDKGWFFLGVEKVAQNLPYFQGKKKGLNSPYLDYIRSSQWFFFLFFSKFCNIAQVMIVRKDV